MLLDSTEMLVLPVQLTLVEPNAEGEGKDHPIFRASGDGLGLETESRWEARWRRRKYCPKHKMKVTRT